MLCVSCVLLFQAGDAPLSPGCKGHVIFKGNSVCIMHLNRERSHRDTHGVESLIEGDIISLTRPGNPINTTTGR